MKTTSLALTLVAAIAAPAQRRAALAEAGGFDPTRLEVWPATTTRLVKEERRAGILTRPAGGGMAP